MSADNGVYILETIGPEYRVEHLQAAENYLWDDKAKAESENPDVHIRNAREMWASSGVYKSKSAALKQAEKVYTEIMSDDFMPICEYGISFIRIPRRFGTTRRKAG